MDLTEWKKAKNDALAIMQGKEWVRWIHDGTEPARTQAEKETVLVWEAVSGKKHCSRCMNLNGCCFPKNIMPQHPLHPHCHCRLEPVWNLNFAAECSADKFIGYIFDPKKNKGKKHLYEDFGYDIMDTKWLQVELIRQGREKYANGDFMLNKLDEHGQRISIEVTLPCKNKLETKKFITGWMVYPDGEIHLTTPFARWTK